MWQWLLKSTIAFINNSRKKIDETTTAASNNNGIPGNKPIQKKSISIKSNITTIAIKVQPRAALRMQVLQSLTLPTSDLSALNATTVISKGILPKNVDNPNGKIKTTALKAMIGNQSQIKDKLIYFPGSPGLPTKLQKKQQTQVTTSIAFLIG